jgi:monoamine oxidase
MPPVVINKINFTPPLSAEREFINQKNFMGDILKVLVLYDTKFWDLKGFTGEMLSDCKDNPCFNVFDDSRTNANGDI